ncbi:universal stress protein [Cocleimonas flava]|uniref:Nucleotide-binding universal stress UspA family protein n=2 Tax=Thiotrichaceae TaxID=135617 RepID=A0A4R1EUY4_9GAMM|nr:nucleotide-binding universal stress UspA family protein [Cocleimonas flava]
MIESLEKYKWKNNMQYKDILVYLDDGKSNAERITTAFSIAESQNARLTAVTLSALKPYHMRASDKKMQRTIRMQEAEKRIEEFNALAAKTGLEYASKIITGDKKEARLRLSQFARNFDLVIFRQANPENKNFELVEKIASKIVVLCGRPVFFMPYIGAHRIPCKNAMIAWDGTPAATRAVHDALPLLKVIDKVIITVVREGNSKTAKGELLADDLVAHLKRHDVNATVNRINAGTFDVATVLLNEIADHSIDMLVMGGYGTPGLKQKVFGGVTETMLKTMITPLVMSH